jgi:hypothetical protein
MEIASEGWRIYVGADAHDWGRAIENLDDARFATGAPGVRAVTYAALTRYMQQYGPINDDIELTVALPQTALSEDHADTTTRGVKSWIEDTHTWTATTHATTTDTDSELYALTISKAYITTQVAGALFDYVLNDDGSQNAARIAHYKQEIGIVSIGMNTVELLGLRNRKVVQAFTHGDTRGVRRLLDLADPQGLYTRGELDAMLRSGDLDISAALPVWSAEVAGMIEQHWARAWRRFKAIICVGGGVLLLRDMLLTTFNGRLFIPEDPLMSIANGVYKLALARK